MEKNKIIILVVAILLVVGLGAVVSSTLVAPQYKEFSDSNIKVEIPAKYNLMIDHNNKNDSLEYTSTNDEITISLTKFEDSSRTNYNEFKTKIKEKYNGISTPMDSKDNNYSGTVYKVKSDLTNKDNYVIIIFDDTKKVAIVLTADSLDAVIQMAQTFKLLNTNFSSTNNATNKTNTTDTPITTKTSSNSNSGNNNNHNSKSTHTPTHKPTPEPTPEPTTEPTPEPTPEE